MAKVATRDLQKEAAWRERLDRQAESGQSIRAWCRRHGITETAFYWWRRELIRRDSERDPAARPDAQRDPAARLDAGDPAASFVPVHVTMEPARDGSRQRGDQWNNDQPHGGQRDGNSRIEIVLTDGRRVHLTGPVNGQTLADVLDVLERRSC